MSSITIHNARILTLAGSNEPRRGHALGDLGVIESGWVRINGGRIDTVGSGDPPDAPEPSDAPDRTDSPGSGENINAGGCVVMPAFVDCHTHACWAGNRYDEFDMKLRGASYLDILRSGGGIMSTVRAVRAASIEQLVQLTVNRLHRMMSLGTGTVEIKSGYGLSTQDELKMLRAIGVVSELVPQHIIPTFLGAHAIDPDQPDFIDATITETLPAVAEAVPGITCDAYCEQGAWNVEQTQRLFEAARTLGCPLRVHADQFNSLGMTKLAIEMGAVSVDHLEATTPADLKLLAASRTIGVALPCCGFQLDDRYAPARSLIDEGGALAIATNYNPGSAPCPSMPFTIALACRKLRLTVQEAITCSTHNAACVLGLQEETGSIESGKRADLQILDCTDEREIGFEFASPGPRLVILNGCVVAQ